MYQSCFGDNQFCLMFRKGVCSYEYMDCWQRLNETTMPEKKEFYSNLTTMGDITDGNYKHPNRVWKDLKYKV